MDTVMTKIICLNLLLCQGLGLARESRSRCGIHLSLYLGVRNQFENKKMTLNGVKFIDKKLIENNLMCMTSIVSKYPSFSTHESVLCMRITSTVAAIGIFAFI